MFPHTTSAHQIQRNYRTIFDKVIKNQEPIIVLNKNKPEVVIMEMRTFEILQEKAENYELEMAKKAIEIAQREKKERKLKKLRSLDDLMK